MSVVIRVCLQKFSIGQSLKCTLPVLTALIDNLLLLCRPISTPDNQEGVLERNLRRTAVVY